MKKRENKFHHLTETDRLIIEKYLKRKIPVREIADELGVHISTVYREIKRGRVLQRNHGLTEEYRYCADTAHAIYKRLLSEKGPGLKIGKDRALAEYIEVFSRVFRSITVDNGSEFADCEGMERSCRGGKRTTVYYCTHTEAPSAAPTRNKIKCPG